MKAKNEEKGSEAGDRGPAVGVIPARLLAAMMKCPTTAGTIDGRRVLGCVHVRDEGDRVLLETTEGKVLMRAVVPGRKEDAVAPWEGNIPVSFATVLDALVAGGASWLVADDVDAGRKEAELSDAGTGSMRVRLFDGKFPDCDAVLPRYKKPVRVMVDAKLAAAMFASMVAMIEGDPQYCGAGSYGQFHVTLTLDGENPNVPITVARGHGSDMSAFGGLLMPVKVVRGRGETEDEILPRLSEFPRAKREQVAQGSES